MLFWRVYTHIVSINYINYIIEYHIILIFNSQKKQTNMLSPSIHYFSDKKTIILIFNF